MIKRCIYDLRFYTNSGSKTKTKTKTKQKEKKKKGKEKKFYLPINIDNKSELSSLSWYKLVQLLHSSQNLVFRNCRETRRHFDFKF